MDAIDGDSAAWRYSIRSKTGGAVPYRCALLFLSVMATLNSSLAETLPPTPYDGGILNVNLGRVGVFDKSGSDWRYGLEYRFEPSLHWQLMPVIGGFTAENDASYVYVGLRRDFPLGQRWVLSPSLDIGLFHDGDALELGDKIEFRNGLEIAYQVRPRYRIGFGMYHLSNGGIGDRNPGTEAAVLSWSIQFK